jgi:RNA polymerase sigma-70 factor (ECF subfamily)
MSDLAHPSGAEPSDAELMRRARRDPRAFDAIYVRHARQIHSWLAARVGEHVAWELTAETFAQAWISRKRFQAAGTGDAASAGPWLQGIAHNLYRGWARSQRIERSAVERLQVQFDIAADHDTDDDLERIMAASLGAELATSLDRLPSEQRRAIELRVIDELPYEVIAERLDCTPDVVRMRVMRGLRALNVELEGIQR